MTEQVAASPPVQYTFEVLCNHLSGTAIFFSPGVFMNPRSYVVIVAVLTCSIFIPAFIQGGEGAARVSPPPLF